MSAENAASSPDCTAATKAAASSLFVVRMLKLPSLLGSAGKSLGIFLEGRVYGIVGTALAAMT